MCLFDALNFELATPLGISTWKPASDCVGAGDGDEKALSSSESVTKLIIPSVGSLDSPPVRSEDDAKSCLYLVFCTFLVLLVFLFPKQKPHYEYQC